MFFKNRSRHRDDTSNWSHSYFNLFLRIAGVMPVMTSGVQVDSICLMKLSVLGCTPCYDESYGSKTTMKNVSACVGPQIFVGGLASNATTFLVGAYGPASVLHNHTGLNCVRRYNGVCWYSKANFSFGFLECGTELNQNKADIGSTSPKSRLSWNIDNGLGGYRAGVFIGLNKDTQGWRKLIYNCPGSDDKRTFFLLLQ